MHSRATDRRSASKCQGKWPDQTLDQAFGLHEVLVAVSTSHLFCKRAGKPRTLMPVWDSSGESRISGEETSKCRGRGVVGGKDLTAIRGREGHLVDPEGRGWIPGRDLSHLGRRSRSSRSSRSGHVED